MPLREIERKRLDEFFAVIEPWENGYGMDSFAYVAVRDGDHLVIVQGTLSLNSIESKAPSNHFESKNIRAGRFRLSEMNIDHRAFVEQILTGSVQTPHDPLKFPPIHFEHSLIYEPVHPSVQQSQTRINVLRLGGAAQTIQERQLLLDWELRSASTPYDNFGELMSDYGLGGLFPDVITIEVIAAAILGFDAISAVNGTTATVIVRLAKALAPANVSVGYRVFSQGKVISRSMLHGNDMQWTHNDDVQIGRAEIQVPAAAVVHCYGNYLGVTQVHWWIADPATSQNSRRTVYETFDHELVVLREFITRSQARGRNARDLEAGVSWLFWMLGFSVAQLGGTGKTQDAADLILVSPSGQYAVVECTTGLLRTDNKMPLLIARTEAVRRRLNASNQSHLKVLSVMVTSRTKEEVRADLEQAQKLEVLVLTQEWFEQALTLTLIAPNADDLFTQAERAIQDALARHNPTPFVNNEI